MSQYKVAVCTLGCKVNFYESEIMISLLRKKGFDICGTNDVCDAYIVNSCSVTGDTDRKVFKLIRRLHRTNPCAVICVTGCMAQLRPDDIANMFDDFDNLIIYGNENKIDIVNKLVKRLDEKKEANTEIHVKDFTNYLHPTKLEEFSRTRAYVKIEDGCDANCSYCTICVARGPVRVRDIDESVEEIQTLANKNCKEIVLTGIEISAYPDLPGLIKRIDSIQGIERVRLSSIDPFYLKPEIVDRLCESKKLMPHFHISLQSGSSRILAKMRRKYNSQRALQNIMYLKNKFENCMLFADIIVGFPTETQEDFDETVDFIKQVGFLHLHIFPYSKRKGTDAAVMEGQVPEDIKNKRAATLARIQNCVKTEIFNRLLFSQKEYKVLVETQSNGVAFGHTEEFIDTLIELTPEQSKYDIKGEILPVKFTGAAVAEGIMKARLV